jgi:hypothetical protein
MWGIEEGGGQSRNFPLLGLFLIVLGVLMAAGEFFAVAAIGAATFFLAIGIMLLLYWNRERSTLALYAGIFLTALSAADLLLALRLISGPGWAPLFLGVGILALVPIRARAGQGWGAAALLGGLLTFWGGSDVLTSYLNFPLDRYVGPLLLVLLGIYLVGRAVRGRDEA